MADIKNYVVQYNIMANIEDAERKLATLLDTAGSISAHFKNIETAFRGVASSIRALAAYKDFAFQPTINVTGFNAQLEQMVASVETAAAKMQTALYNALTASNKSVVQKAGEKAAKKSLADLRKERDAVQRLNEHYFGKDAERTQKYGKNFMFSPKSMFGRQFAAGAKIIKDADTKGVVHKQWESRRAFVKDMHNRMLLLKGLDEQIAAAEKEAQQTTPTAVANQNKVKNKAAKATGQSSANITAKELKAIDKLLGGKQGRTYKVLVKAVDGITPALPKLNEALAKVPAEKTVTITPILSQTPITQATKKGAKGKATQPTYQVPATLKILTTGLQKTLNNLGTYTIPVSLAAKWPKGALNKNGELKALTKAIPTPTLNLNITPAQTAFRAFLAEVQQHNTLFATLYAAPGGKTPVSVPLAGGGGTVTGVPATSTTSTKKAKATNWGKTRQTMFNNAMAPWQLTPQQSNAIIKNRRFFKAATKATGIVPTPNMAPAQMATYLNAVTTAMTTAGYAVPKPLQTYMNNLNKQLGLGPSKPIPITSTDNRTYFDRAKKWGYLFTGQTSFGMRTPMAVDMAKGMGVMFAISGAMSAISNSFGQAVEYQNTMETAKAILQNGTKTYTDSGYKQMEKNIRKIGVQTKFSAPEVADAARFLAMAGYDIPQINDAIRPITQLALMGDQNLGEVADKMTNIMTTFQIPAAKMREAGNIMATTATRTNTDLMMLAESAKYGGGVAKMYGGKDPNLFADTMAIFGVMGNAGIQASSAGTALRMMYQNIFKPNKKQQAVLERLKSQYGISTINSDGSYRAMSAILTDMAQRIPQSEMASIIGSLFRITAQPGANAAIMAATNANIEDIAALAEEEGTDVNEALKGYDQIGKYIEKFGLSKLAELMEANRRSVSGNILESVANKKQNTIQGLWAQVTSMFTEGIVKAFENKMPYFTEMLGKLRDYLARPETVRMLENILDLVIGIGEVLGTVAKIWANIYSIAPGLIKTWVILQMCFTQFGTLLTPVISLIGAFQRLGGAIFGLGAATAGATGQVAAANAVAGGSALATGATAAAGAAGSRAAATGAAAGAAYAAPMVFPMGGGKKPVVGRTTGRAASKAFRRGIAKTIKWTPNMLIMGPALKNLAVQASGFMGKAIGAIFNPMSIATMVLGGIGYGIYKQASDIQEKQERHSARQEAALESAATTSQRHTQPFNNMLSSSKQAPLQTAQDSTSQKLAEYDKQRKEHLEQWSSILNLGTEGANEKSNIATIAFWRKQYESNPVYQWALGDKKDEILFGGLDADVATAYESYNSFRNNAKVNPWAAGSSSFAGEVMSAEKNKAKISDPQAAKLIQDHLMQMAVYQMGATQQSVIEASKKIIALKKYKNAGKITGEEYAKQVAEIRGAFMDNEKAAQFSSVGITSEHFQQLTDFSHYKEYWKGALNVIDAYIAGEKGTETGAIDAFMELQKKANQFSENWYQSIGNIVTGYKVVLNALSPDHSLLGDAAVTLSTDKNGILNYESIKEQFLGSHADAVYGWRQYGQAAATVYAKLAEMGLANQDESAMKKYIHQQLNAQNQLSGEDLRAYYASYIKGNKDWEDYTYEQWHDWLQKSTDTHKLANGKEWTQADEWRAIRGNLSKDIAHAYIMKYGWAAQGDYQNPYKDITSQNKQDIKIELHIEKLVNFENPNMNINKEDIDNTLVPAVTDAISAVILGNGNGYGYGMPTTSWAQVGG